MQLRLPAPRGKYRPRSPLRAAPDATPISGRRGRAAARRGAARSCPGVVAAAPDLAEHAGGRAVARAAGLGGDDLDLGVVAARRRHVRGDLALCRADAERG